MKQVIIAILLLIGIKAFPHIPRKRSAFCKGTNALMIPREVHFLNRKCIIDRLKSNVDLPTKTLVLLQGGKSTYLYSSDTEPLFQQESYFHWTFGVEQPDFLGAIDLSTNKSYLFMPKLPEYYIVWMGKIDSPQDIQQKYLMDEVFHSDNITNVLQSLDPDFILTLHGVNSDSGLFTEEATFEGINLFSVNNTILFHEITECRVIKNDIELEIMRFTSKISSEAHKEVMRRIRPGMKEYMIESIFQYYCSYHGAMRYSSYTSVCASGENSAVLHYGHAGEPNDKTINDGDMCLFDMGGKYYGYASDITCSFPANGTFTDDQRIIYEAVLKANRKVITAAKPGVSWLAMHELAEKTILEELTKFGMLKGNIQDMIDANLASVFLPHGLGHLIGCDVHDVGGYPEEGPSRPTRSGARSLRTSRILQKGMVLTVEPGIYFIDYLIDEALTNPNQSHFINTEVINRFRGFGGVRIEDEIIVTTNGTEVISDVPRDIEEIEDLMAEGRKLNVLLPLSLEQNLIQKSEDDNSQCL